MEQIKNIEIYEKQLEYHYNKIHELLATFSQKISVCPECGVKFFRKRIDQKFDTVRCQNKVATRLFKQNRQSN